MTGRLSSRDRRAVHIGLALVLPLSLLLLVGRPLHRARAELREELRREQALLGREQALLAARHDLDRGLDARLSHLRKVAAITFDGSESLVSSSLARAVGSVAGSAGLEVRSAASRGLSDQDRLRFAEMDAVLVGEWSAVVAFLRQVAAYEKDLTVQAFTLSEIGSTSAQRRPVLQLEARIAALVAPMTPPPFSLDSEPQ